MVKQSVLSLHEAAGIPPVPLEIRGKSGLLSSAFRVDTLAAASIGAASGAAAVYWELRGGPRARVELDLGHAELAFLSERLFKIAGNELELWADLSGDYRTRDGWVRLHCNFPAHRAAAVRALGGAPDRDAVTAACLERTSLEVEESVLAEGGAAAALRPRDEWAAFPHGPLVGLERLSDGPVVRSGAAARPLEGVRVLDLTRVIAGPVATRMLAAYGADVLRIGAAHVPEVPGLVLDMGFGKRSCHLDLRTEHGRACLRELVATADVLVQGYRPGALAALGFGPERLRELNPSLVSVDVSAYEPGSPWYERRGFDSLVQLATGLAYAGEDRPVPLPAQALDHATGYLAAFAAIAGLVHRATTGGSWHARSSLAGTARWLDSLGRREPAAATPPPDDRIAAVDTPHGVLTFVLPPGRVSGQAPRWDSPPPLDGSSPPVWL
ncbi:CoA transferase [Actinocorallia populi]|uniref:CoA transferase n=1 Tax=Actinocorallia populi TaxID=2079200 RepID=UPI000D08CF61|nr:CoA transferase [Actinocorallia populi]